MTYKSLSYPFPILYLRRTFNVELVTRLKLAFVKQRHQSSSTLPFRLIKSTLRGAPSFCSRMVSSNIMSYSTFPSFKHEESFKLYQSPKPEWTSPQTQLVPSTATGTTSESDSSANGSETAPKLVSALELKTISLDPASLPKSDMYHLMISTVVCVLSIFLIGLLSMAYQLFKCENRCTQVPRPIALVSTISTAGVGNVAPYSYFTSVCHDPPTLMVRV
jgi:hypothetical protein